jgi:hypothetical protein
MVLTSKGNWEDGRYQTDPIGFLQTRASHHGARTAESHITQIRTTVPEVAIYIYQSLLHSTKTPEK